jgi:hypothetical protein
MGASDSATEASDDDGPRLEVAVGAGREGGGDPVDAGIAGGDPARGLEDCAGAGVHGAGATDRGMVRVLAAASGRASGPASRATVASGPASRGGGVGAGDSTVIVRLIGLRKAAPLQSLL